jgi:hypothetical protein
MHIGINYFAKNGRIEEGNLNLRVDSTGYIISLLVLMRRRRLK